MSAGGPRASSLPCIARADARSDVLTDVEFDAFEVWVGKTWAERGAPPTPEEVCILLSCRPLVLTEDPPGVPRP